MHKKGFHIIIPTRLNSVRLPGKALIDIKGKTLIQRVYERVTEIKKELAAYQRENINKNMHEDIFVESIIVATDNDQIEAECRKFGAEVCRTSSTAENGTERLAEAVETLGLHDDEIVVNVQGDEPLIPAQCVASAVFGLIQNTDAFLASVTTPILDPALLENPNCVKVVMDKDGYALYFSRNMLPYPRTATPQELVEKQVFYKHVGVYAYRVSALKRYSTFPIPMLEQVEQLEPLRVLYQGEKIHLTVVQDPVPTGVDTFADLETVRALV